MQCQQITDHADASELVMKSKGNKQWLVRFFPDGDLYVRLIRSLGYGKMLTV
jgi:hypothetical protein